MMPYLNLSGTAFSTRWQGIVTTVGVKCVQNFKDRENSMQTNGNPWTDIPYPWCMVAFPRVR